MGIFKEYWPMGSNDFIYFFIFAMELGNKLCRWSDLRRFAGTGVGDQVAVVFK